MSKLNSPFICIHRIKGVDSLDVIEPYAM